MKLPCRGAEIGVQTARMSKVLLQNFGVRLIMVDSWADAKDQPRHYADSGDRNALYTAAEQQAHYECALRDTEFARERRTVIRKPSVEAAKDIEDASLDFVFIDADHSYEGCFSDIEAWLPKLRKKGVIGGHDYGAPGLDGVKKAVDKMAEGYGWNLELGMNFTWFARP